MLTIPRHFPIRKTPKRYKPAANNPNINPTPTLAAICTIKKKKRQIRTSPLGMTMQKRKYVYTYVISDFFKTVTNIEDAQDRAFNILPDHPHPSTPTHTQSHPPIKMF